MSAFLEFLLQLLSQFAGGPGMMENNLVRFILPAILWGVLLVVAWSRQHEHKHNLPRERLLVWGFGLGFSSAVLMTIFVSLQMLQVIDREETYALLIPLDRALAMASVLVVAGAFLRYILDDERLAHTYLRIGLGITFLCLVIALWQWPHYLAILTEDRFHTIWISWIFEVFSSILIITAILLLRRKPGWLTNVMMIALALFLISELLTLVNFATDKRYNRVFCPIGNSLQFLAIPLLGYVYLREQSIEKQRAEKDLEVYRHHLEDLITQRTAEIMTVNDQLKHEINDRKQAEEALEKLSRQYELILESAGEGICGINPQGRFSFVNPAAARALGYQVNELIGRPCHIVWQQPGTGQHTDQETRCPIVNGYTRGIPARGDDQLFWRKDNTSFPVLFVSNPTFENGQLTGSVVVFRDITERKLAEAEIAQRNVNLAAQNAVAATLSRSLDLETILNTALDAVLSVVNMEVGLVFLWDPELEDLTLRSWRGLLLQEGAKGAKPEWTCCGAISARALSTMQAVIQAVSDCPVQPQKTTIVSEGLETLVSVPLVSSGRAIGALTLGSRQTAPVRPPELELLTAIGQQIGMAIENAHLYSEAERAAEELSLLHQASIALTSTLRASAVYDQIVEQAVKLLNCQMACVLIWEEEEQRVRLVSGYGISEADAILLQTHPEPSGHLRDLIQRQEPAVFGNVRAGSQALPDWAMRIKVQALLCVPLSGMNDVPGSLLLMDRRSPHRLQIKQMVLIENFVNRAAVALMNANLCRQLEWAAALEERQRIAADMHDGLAQTVSLLGMQTEEAIERIRAGSDNAAVEELSNMRDTVEQISIEVRQSIASLHRKPQPRRSLQELLSTLPEQLSLEDSRPVDLIFAVQEPIFLSREQVEQVLPVVQEALLNAQRHARAQRIAIFLEPKDQKVQITVEDNGQGFEIGEWWEGSRDHFGLSIMHSRAAKVGARLRIDSAPGQGTRVTLLLPVPSSVCNRLGTVPQTDLSQARIHQGVEI